MDLPWIVCQATELLHKANICTGCIHTHSSTISNISAYYVTQPSEQLFIGCFTLLITLFIFGSFPLSVHPVCSLVFCSLSWSSFDNSYTQLFGCPWDTFSNIHMGHIFLEGYYCFFIRSLTVNFSYMVHCRDPKFFFMWLWITFKHQEMYFV